MKANTSLIPFKKHSRYDVYMAVMSTGNSALVHTLYPSTNFPKRESSQTKRVQRRCHVPTPGFSSSSFRVQHRVKI